MAGVDLAEAVAEGEELVGRIVVGDLVVAPLGHFLPHVPVDGVGGLLLDGGEHGIAELIVAHGFAGDAQHGDVGADQFSPGEVVQGGGYLA